nr:hypothetical protein [Myxococcus vastator]
MLPQWLIPLLSVLLAGCSGPTKSVRLHTGHREPIVLTARGDDAAPVELDEDHFVEAVEALARSVRPSIRPQET